MTRTSSFLICLFAVATVALPPATVQAASGSRLDPAQTCSPRWHHQPSPSPGNLNIWAVGEYGTSDGFSVPLLEHWNGSFWTAGSADHEPMSYNTLLGIGKVGRVRWAVGTEEFESPISISLIEVSCAP